MNVFFFIGNNKTAERTKNKTGEQKLTILYRDENKNEMVFWENTGMVENGIIKQKNLYISPEGLIQHHCLI